MKKFYRHDIANLVILQTPTLWQTYRNYNYIVSQGGRATVIDPGELAPIQATIAHHGLQVEKILLTHHHPDHTNATEALARQWNCEVIGYRGDQHRLPPLTVTYEAQALVDIAGYSFQVMHLPGHTLGLCALYCEELKMLFSNDLIFSLGCGRVFEGTPKQMQESLKRVRDLPDDTVIFSSHEYTLANLEFGLSLFPNDPALNDVRKSIIAKTKNEQPTVPMTLGFEKVHNPFLRWDDIEIRKVLGLGDAEDWQVFAEIRSRKDSH